MTHNPGIIRLTFFVYLCHSSVLKNIRYVTYCQNLIQAPLLSPNDSLQNTIELAFQDLSTGTDSIFILNTFYASIKYAAYSMLHTSCKHSRNSLKADFDHNFGQQNLSGFQVLANSQTFIFMITWQFV